MSFFGYNFLFVYTEEKLLMHLEVARQIGYVLLIIVMLFLALRNCKRNGGHGGQTTSSVNGASEDGSDAGSNEIATAPISLALTATMSMRL